MLIERRTKRTDTLAGSFSSISLSALDTLVGSILAFLAADLLLLDKESESGSPAELLLLFAWPFVFPVLTSLEVPLEAASFEQLGKRTQMNY